MSDQTLTIRHPETKDAAAVWQLVCDCPPLDKNSSYLYLLLCGHFSSTCLVAEKEGKVVGFVSGYMMPTSPDTLFVWQVAVHESARKQGLAKRFLHELTGEKNQGGPRYIEATISPSNNASKNLFRSFAEEKNVKCEESAYFAKEHFPSNESHEEEHLFCIGPFNTLMR